MRTGSAKPRAALHPRKDPSSDPESEILLLHSRLKDVVASLIEYADLTDSFLSTHPPARELLDRLTAERTKWENCMIYALGVKEVTLRRRFHMPVVTFDGDFGKVTELLATTQSRLSNTLRKSGLDPGSILWDSFSDLNQRFWDQFFAGKKIRGDDVQLKTLLEEQETRIKQLKEQLKSAERDIQIRDKALERLQGEALKPSQSSHHLRRVRAAEQTQEESFFRHTQKPPQQIPSPMHMRTVASGTLDLRSLKDPIERVMLERDQLRGMIRSKSPGKTFENVEAEHNAEKLKLRAVISDLRRQISELKGEESPGKSSNKSAEEYLRLEKERSQAFFKALRGKEKECEELVTTCQTLQEQLDSVRSQQAESQFQAVELKKRDEQAEKMLLKVQTDLERTSTMLKTLRDDKEMQTMEIKQLRAANGVLEVKYQRSTSKLVNLERKLLEKTEELTAIQSKIQELEDFQSDFESISSLKTQISEMTQQNSELEDENRHLRESLEFNRSQLEKTVQTLDDVKKESEFLREDLVAFEENWIQAIKSIEEKFGNVEKRLKMTENGVKKIGENRSLSEKLRSELDFYRSKISTLEFEIQSKDQEIDELKVMHEIHSAAPDSLEQLNIDFTLSQEEVKRLSEALETVEEEINRKNEEISRKNEEIGRWENREKEEIEENLRVKSELNEIKRELMEGSKNWEKEKNTWKNLEMGLKEQIKKTKNELVALESVLKSKENEISQLEKRLSAINKESLERRINELEESLKSANFHIKSLQNDKETAQKSLQNALQSQEGREKMQEMQRNMQILEEKVGNLQKENMDLKDNSLGTSQKMHSLQQDLKAKKKEISQLNIEKNELEEQIKSIKTSEMKLKDAIQRLTESQTPESDQRKLSSLQSEFEELTATISNMLEIVGVETAAELAPTLLKWTAARTDFAALIKENQGKLNGETPAALGNYVKNLENELTFLKSKIKTQKMDLDTEIDNLRRQIGFLEDENGNLERNLMKSKADFEQKMHKFEENLANLTAQRDRLSAELAASEANLATFRQEISEETQKIAIKKDKEREEIAKKLNEMIEDKKTAEMLIERLNRELELAKNQGKSTEIKILQENSLQIDEFNRKIAEMTEEISRITLENEKLARENLGLKSENENFQVTLSNLKKNHLEALEKANSEHQSLETNLKKALEARKILQGDVKLLENELKLLENELKRESEARKVLEDDVKLGKNELKIAENDLEKEKNKVKILQEKLEKSGNELEEKETVISRMKAEIATLASEKASFESQCEHLMSELSQMTSSSHQKSLQTDSIRLELAQLKSQIETLTGEKGKLEAANRRLAQDLEASHRKENELKSELQSEKSHIESDKNTLERELEREKDRKETLEKELRNAEEVKIGLEIDCKQRENRIEELEKSVLEWKNQVKSREEEKKRESEEKAEKEKEIEELNRKIGELNRKLQEISSENDRKNSFLDKIKQEKSQLETENATLRREISDLTLNTAKLNEQIQEMTAKLANFQEKHVQSEINIAKLNSEIESFQRKIVQINTEFEEKIEKLASENHNLGEKISKLTIENQKMQTENSQFHTQISALSTENSHLQANLTESNRLRKHESDLISSQKQTIKSLETSKSSLISDLDHQKAQISQLSSSISQLQLHEQALIDRIAELEEEIRSKEVVEVEEVNFEGFRPQEMEVAAGNVREIDLSTERESMVEEEPVVPIIYYSAGTSERVKKEDMKRIAAFLTEMVAKTNDKFSDFLSRIPNLISKIELLEDKFRSCQFQISKLSSKIAFLESKSKEEDEVSNPEAPRPSIGAELLVPCMLVQFEGRAWVLVKAIVTGEYHWQEPGHGVDTAPLVVSEDVVGEMKRVREVQERNRDLQERAEALSGELRKIRELLEDRGFNFQGETLYSVINAMSLPRKRGPASSKARPAASEEYSEPSLGSKERLSPDKPSNFRAVTSPLGHSEKLSDSSHSKALSEDESQQVFRTITKLMKDNDELVKELNDAQRQIHLYKTRLMEMESQHNDPVSSSEIVITVQNLLEILPPW